MLLVSFLARAIRKVVHLSSLKIKPTSTKKSVLVVTTIHIVEPLSKESPRGQIEASDFALASQNEPEGC